MESVPLDVLAGPPSHREDGSRVCLPSLQVSYLHVLLILIRYSGRNNLEEKGLA